MAFLPIVGIGKAQRENVIFLGLLSGTVIPLCTQLGPLGFHLFVI
jgi:hypothetical protein